MSRSRLIESNRELFRADQSAVDLLNLSSRINTGFFRSDVNLSSRDPEILHEYGLERSAAQISQLCGLQLRKLFCCECTASLTRSFPLTTLYSTFYIGPAAILSHHSPSLPYAQRFNLTSGTNSVDIIEERNNAHNIRADCCPDT